MKHLFLASLISIIPILVNAQDTTYIDYLNRTYNSIPPQFIVVDTNTIKDDSTIINQLLTGQSSTYLDTVGNTFNSYLVDYTVTKLQGGTSGFFQIDTNSTQLSFTSLSTVTGTFINDSMKLDSSSNLTFTLSASTASTALRIQGQIYHTTTYIFVRLNLPSLDTVYYDLNTNQSVSKSFASSYPILSVKQDTTYFNDTSDNVYAIKTTLTHSVPSVQSKYYLIFEAEYKAGGFAWSIDTNNVQLHGALNHGGLAQNGPLYDTLILNGGSTMDYNISNMSNGGRYFVTSKIFHTVDTVFVNSMSTNINEIKTSNRIKAYPNPTNDYLYIDRYNGKEFEIIDLKGVVLMNGIIQDRIDLIDLTNGLYILKIGYDVIKILKE